MTEKEKKFYELGKVLQSQRQKMELTLDILSEDLQVSLDYLKALEEGNYAIFPAKVYALGFLKKLISFLGLNDAKEEMLAEFEIEWERQKFISSAYSAARDKRKLPVITLGKIGIVAGGVAIVVLLVFLGARLFYFISAPELTILEPAENELMVRGSFIWVKGNTRKESVLSINGRELKVDGEGRFSEKIELVSGLNYLKFNSQDRFGKISQVVKYVVKK